MWIDIFCGAAIKYGEMGGFPEPISFSRKRLTVPTALFVLFEQLPLVTFGIRDPPQYWSVTFFR